jgi:hypothetical protein
VKVAVVLLSLSEGGVGKMEGKRKGRWGGHAEPPRWPSPSMVELRPTPSSSRVLSRHERD